MSDQKKATPDRYLDISPECRELVETERLAAIRSSMRIFAHEVGNKVNNLSLQVQMLDRELRKEDHPLLARSQRLRSDVQALGALLVQFSALDRSEALERSPVDLVKVVAEVCALEQGTAAASRVRVVQHAVPDVALVRAHLEDLRQTVSHLYRNALEAMPNGGTLTIEIGKEGGDVTLTLEDSGRGISPDVDVFRPFQTTKKHHLGLGLAFVRHLVKRHGGSVRYRSSLGKGTQFVVALPAHVE